VPWALGLTASRRPQHKIKLSGRLSGKRRSLESAGHWQVLVCARVLAGQAFYRGFTEPAGYSWEQ
jgi:hypothetical protein